MSAVGYFQKIWMEALINAKKENQKNEAKDKEFKNEKNNSF